MQIDIASLKTALQKVTRAVSHQNANPGAVTLVGKDGDLAVHKCDGSSFARATVKGQEIPDFKMVVDGSKLIQILGAVNPTHTLTVGLEKACLKLKVGGARLKLDRLEAEPMLLESNQWVGASESAQTTGSHLQSVLKHAAASAARKDTRYYLNGVLFAVEDGKISLVATNGFVLTWVSTGISAKKMEDTIVPIDIVESLIGNLEPDDEVSILAFKKEGQAKGIGFRTPTFEVLCPAIEGRFPGYKGVLPKVSPNELPGFSMDCAEFLGALDRIGMMAGFNRAPGVQLQVNGSAIKLFDRGGENVEDMVAGSAPTDLTIDKAFNPSQLTTAIKSFNAKTFRLCVIIDSPQGEPPVVLSRGEEGLTAMTVVMPMNA